MTVLEAKELLIQNLQAKIEGYLTPTNLTTRYSTCSHSNWNREEYLYMPEVARRLIKKGYSVRHEVNHGVDDWFIAV